MGWESQREASESQGAAAHAERSGVHRTIPVFTAGIPLIILLPCFPSGPHFSCPVGSISRAVFRPKPLGMLIIGKEVDARVIWEMLAGNDAWGRPQGFVLVQLPTRRHLKGKTSASKGLPSKDGGLGGGLGRSSVSLHLY